MQLVVFLCGCAAEVWVIWFWYKGSNRCITIVGIRERTCRFGELVDFLWPSSHSPLWVVGVQLSKMRLLGALFALSVACIAGTSRTGRCFLQATVIVIQ